MASAHEKRAQRVLWLVEAKLPNEVLPNVPQKCAKYTFSISMNAEVKRHRKNYANKKIRPIIYFTRQCERISEYFYPSIFVL